MVALLPHVRLVSAVPVRLWHPVLCYKGARVPPPLLCRLRASPSLHALCTVQLEITQFVSTLLYFGYMSMMAFAFFLLTGTIGFLSCLTFVRKIYSSIKVD